MNYWPLQSEVTLNAYDLSAIRHIESELTKGLALATWWRQRGDEGSRVERFGLVNNHRGWKAYGSRQLASIAGLGSIPLVAAVQSFPFTHPKIPPRTQAPTRSETMSEIREFVLRYFLRSTSYAQAQSYPALGRPPVSGLSRLLSWCPAEGVALSGVELRQEYFRKHDGTLGKFHGSSRRTIVDLRNIGPVYRWVALSARLLDTSVSISLSGADSPQLLVPDLRKVYLILTPDLMVDQRTGSPQDEVTQICGPGFVYLDTSRNPTRSYLPAFEVIYFRTASNGATNIDTVFACKEPTSPRKIVINLERLRMSRTKPSATRASVRQFLYRHCLEQHRRLTGALQIWSRIRDWCDPSTIPPWITCGVTND